ncbi:MAG: hypothetical protein AAFU54_18610 [Chloroflexota bacterium]
MQNTKTLSTKDIVQTLLIMSTIVLWAVISLIVVFAVAMSHLREYQLLASLDSVTTGAFIGTDVEMKAPGGQIGQIEEVSQYFLVYEYTVDGETYPGRVATTFGTYVDFEPGAEVEVRYNSGEPASSVVNQEPSLANFYGSAVFFVVWAVIVGVVLYNFVWGSESLQAILNMRKGKST